MLTAIMQCHVSECFLLAQATVVLRCAPRLSAMVFPKNLLNLQRWRWPYLERARRSMQQDIGGTEVFHVHVRV